MMSDNVANIRLEKAKRVIAGHNWTVVEMLESVLEQIKAGEIEPVEMFVAFSDAKTGGIAYRSSNKVYHSIIGIIEAAKIILVHRSGRL